MQDWKSGTAMQAGITDGYRENNRLILIEPLLDHVAIDGLETGGNEILVHIGYHWRATLSRLVVHRFHAKTMEAGSV